jgi:2,5-diamino-6-(ribosylamino)-4(3H)-pyrimidinone 5'-phosphate reductase
METKAVRKAIFFLMIPSLGMNSDIRTFYYRVSAKKFKSPERRARVLRNILVSFIKESVKPRIIIHNAVSADGRIDRVAVDLGLYYRIAGTFEEEATLVGTDTLLQSPAGAALLEEPADSPAPPAPDPDDDRALLVVPDGRGRIRNWTALRRLPYWRDVVALAPSTASVELIGRLKRQGVRYFLAGRDRVDFAAALGSLRSLYGVRTIRVDSGGTLNGVLLRAGLVDEVSLLIHPQLVGGACSPSLFFDPGSAPDAGPISLELAHWEKLDGGVLWVRYTIIRP